MSGLFQGPCRLSGSDATAVHCITMFGPPSPATFQHDAALCGVAGVQVQEPAGGQQHSQDRLNLSATRCSTLWCCCHTLQEATEGQ